MEHLVHCLKKHYAKVSEDWEGKLYCGITLDWKYIERWVVICMPGYNKRLRQRYEHISPKKMQHGPYRAQPKIYVAAVQESIPADDSSLINDERKKLVQKIISGVFYYGRAVDLTVLPALSSIVSEQAIATENTENKCAQLLDYLATHDNARIRYHAYDMVLNIHFDAS